jgi:hypothetical protein
MKGKVFRDIVVYLQGNCVGTAGGFTSGFENEKKSSTAAAVISHHLGLLAQLSHGTQNQQLTL